MNRPGSDLDPTSRPARTPVEAYDPARLDYRWSHDAGAFAHQYDRDLQLLVIWSKGREREAEILDLVAAEFTILAQVEVRWSAAKTIYDFERLYGQTLWGTSPKHEEVGDGPFLLLILEDPAPAYSYRSNVTGYVELTNVNVARVKAAARALTGGYRIHSSNNLREFFRDATLILGPERLDAILAQDAPAAPTVLAEDVVGGHGWESLDQVFRTLRRTSRYVVLRNFEELPGKVEEDREIDVLCDDQTDLAAVLNATEVYPGPEGAAFRTTVAGEEVLFDIRHVGDGYLDTTWQREILGRREWHESLIAVPRHDDHLFSLLYHAKVQKPSVKPAYAPRLTTLALEVGLPEPIARALTDDAVAASQLDGYLAGHGFTVPLPHDPAVHRNAAFLERFRLTPLAEPPLKVAREELWASAKRSRAARVLGRSRVIRGAYRRLRSAAHALKNR
ncbi:hypothetical protein [Oerskovia turbata]